MLKSRKRARRHDRRRAPLNYRGAPLEARREQCARRTTCRAVSKSIGVGLECMKRCTTNILKADSRRLWLSAAILAIVGALVFRQSYVTFIETHYPTNHDQL